MACLTAVAARGDCESSRSPSRPSEELGRLDRPRPGRRGAPRRDRRHRAHAARSSRCSTCESGAARCSAAAWADRIYWATLFAFWTVLLAVPLAGNLGAAWLAIEATTAASALLVGFSGRARALEAGWKYLILTSLGLGIALLGILVLEGAAGGGGIESLTWRSLPQATLDPETTVVAYVLLLAGLAAKIGWAPVHNWLPDAHSEAPAPISALLSAALLPAVLLVAWRTQQALAPTIGVRTAGGVLVGFGLASLAVAVPFLWRSQAWKRLLAYSSLEHMGVIALGIGFGGTLALAGVAIHIVGHALAKALGFYAAGAAARARPARSRTCGRGRRTNRAEARGVPRHFARRARGPAALPALRQRGADRRGRLPGRAAVGRWRSGDPARAGLPRARSRSRRHRHRPPARTRSSPCVRPACRDDPDGGCGAAAARPHRGGALAAELRHRSRSRAGPGMSASLQSGVAYRERVDDRTRRRLAVREPTRDPHRRGAGRAHRARRRRPASSAIESTAATSGSVPTIVDLAPAAGWDEREAHDLYGVRFDGHEPLRPLVDHDGPVDRFTTPVRGVDPYQVAVGPIHAGVIESGHFRFHVVGDLILHVDARLFYKHRGLERAAEGLLLEDALPVVARACAGCWVTNAVAYAHACEEALGLMPTPELARARTILLELERVWNTLNDIAAICAGVGLGGRNEPVRSARGRRQGSERAAHRPPVPVRLGGGRWQRSRSGRRSRARCADDARAGSAASRHGPGRHSCSTARSWTGCPTSASSMPTAVETLGVVGIAARAAGVSEDVRATSPRLAYDGFEPAVLRRAVGDVQSRLEQRALELLPSLDRLDALLADPLRPAAAAPHGGEQGIGIGRVESPRGATVCVVERRGGAVGARSPADGLVRELARRRLCGEGQPAARLPAHQQELRALLRVRRPLMLTLLRDLRRLRRKIGLPAADRPGSLAVRHVDCGSCNGCEHELTLVSGPDVDLARFGLGIVASPRHADVLLVTAR